MVAVREALALTPLGTVDRHAWAKRVQYSFSERMATVFETLEARLSPQCYQALLHQALSIAECVYGLNRDPYLFTAALLYPFFRASKISKETLVACTNMVTLQLIEGVCLIEVAKARGRSFGDKLRSLLLAVVEDVRVVLITLSERLYSVRFSAQQSPKERKKLAIELRDLYAPLANRLGILQLKWEMEDLAFHILEPVAYKHIAKLLDEKRKDRERYIDTIVCIIQKTLEKAGLKVQVTGRPKHIFSIWKKMCKKSLAFQEIHDVHAVRLLVETLPECYAALGVIHAAWQPIAKTFDDYIVTPKANGYRSLHTAVIGPEGRSVEIQMRTFAMHQEAELGLAAHWVYKEGVHQEKYYQDKIMALRQLLEWQETFILDAAKEETETRQVSKERVYVFTPKGEVIDLVQGSTPLDFAYHVHTELGHRSKGAKVNQVMVPLTYTLRSGDQLEIITAKHGVPSRDWLNPQLGYLRSKRAIEKVLRYFKPQTKEQPRQSGLLPLEPIVPALEGIPISAPKMLKTAANVVVRGMGHVMTHFAKCCKPLPGDLMIGYITVGRGITIHRQDCAKVAYLKKLGKYHHARFIEATFGEAQLSLYTRVDVLIQAYDRQGLLRDITGVLSQEKVNVIAAHTHTNSKDNIARMRLSVEVSDLAMLERVLCKIQELSNVVEAKRCQA